jgi:hypothetical protein
MPECTRSTRNRTRRTLVFSVHLSTVDLIRRNRYRCMGTLNGNYISSIGDCWVTRRPQVTRNECHCIISQKYSDFSVLTNHEEHFQFPVHGVFFWLEVNCSISWLESYYSFEYLYNSRMLGLIMRWLSYRFLLLQHSEILWRMFELCYLEAISLKRLHTQHRRPVACKICRLSIWHPKRQIFLMNANS